MEPASSASLKIESSKGESDKARRALDQRVDVLKSSIAFFESHLDFQTDVSLSFWLQYDVHTGELCGILNDDQIRDRMRVIRWERLEISFFLHSGHTFIKYEIVPHPERKERKWVHYKNAFFPIRDDLGYLYNVNAFEWLLNYVVDFSRVEEAASHPLEEGVGLSHFFSAGALQSLLRRPTAYPSRHLVPSPLELIVRRSL